MERPYLIIFLVFYGGLYCEALAKLASLCWHETGSIECCKYLARKGIFEAGRSNDELVQHLNLGRMFAPDSPGSDYVTKAAVGDAIPRLSAIIKNESVNIAVLTTDSGDSVALSSGGRIGPMTLTEIAINSITLTNSKTGQKIIRMVEPDHRLRTIIASAAGPSLEKAEQIIITGPLSTVSFGHTGPSSDWVCIQTDENECPQ